MAITETWGPAEAEVTRLVRAFGLDAGHATAEAVPRSKVGDIRVDLGQAASKPSDLGPSVCAALVDLPLVESAAFVPPRIYVRTTVPFLSDAVLGWIEQEGEDYGSLPVGSRDDVLVTFSDPNANKPLHVGHLRNLFLGSALAALHAKRGHRTRREGSFSDWGVHMCQALLSYVREGATRTPAEAGLRGDHFVGELYTRYHAEVAGGEGDGDDDQTARSLLLRLEAGDELEATHQRLVDWAIDGIRSTYRRVGVDFDASFRETDHLATARRVIRRGLDLGQLHRREDGCVVYRHDEDRETVLVRADGTLLVYAQILGIDVDRFAGRSDRVVSIFGHQWEAAALAYRDAAQALAEPWADRYQPVFYGMVQLPDGSMRSREGRAVTADDAIDQLRDALPPDFGASLGVDRDALAVAVLKYYLLRRARTKNLVFDLPVALERTVPFFARVLAYAHPDMPPSPAGNDGPPERGASKRELTALRRLLLGLNGFGSALDSAVTRLDPAVVLHYLEELVGLADQLPAGAWTNRLRQAVAVVVRQCLASVDIGAVA